MRVFGEQGVSLLLVTDSRNPAQVIREACTAVGFDNPNHFLLKRAPESGVVFPAEDLAGAEQVYMFNRNKQGGSGVVRIEPLENVCLLESRYVYWCEKRLHVCFPFGHKQDEELSEFVRKYISKEFTLYQSATLFCEREDLPAFCFICIKERNDEWNRNVVFFSSPDTFLYDCVSDSSCVPKEEYPIYAKPYQMYLFETP